MATTPNTNISPALDPITYQSVHGYDDSTRGYVDDVVSLMNDTYATLDKLIAARKLADSNGAWTEEQKLLIVGKEAAKQKARLAGRLDRTMRDLDGRIEQVQNELARPVQQGAAFGPLASEVRAHCKSLDGAGRSKLIREAIEADDTDTLHAVLGGQPFLSGLSREDQSYYLHRLNSQKQPHLVARLELMTRVRDLMEKNGANGPVFHRAFEKVVGAPPGRVSAIDRADADARAALNIEPTA